jgi:iron complex outermembrane receptor protein
MNKRSERKFWGRVGLALNAGLAVAATSVALGQTSTAPGTPAATATDQTVKLEKFVVTGSNIPQAADALAMPVAVIDTHTIADSGVSFNTLDLLRKVMPNISGIGDENAQIATTSNYGGAQLTIKNLTTLVLIDGHRVASDPVEGQGGNEFVDLNTIPMAAIDRFEVLQNGASAIYGSDAIGGVINIILKKNWNGWQMGGHYGFSNDSGHYRERSAYIGGGVSTPKSSITVSFEYGEHDPLYEVDRPYTNPIYGTYTFPGSLEVYNNTTGSDQFYQLAPGVNAPPAGGKYTIDQLVAMGIYVPKSTTAQFQAFNLANGETLIQKLKRYSAMVNAERNIFGDHLVGYGNLMFSDTKTMSQLNAQPVVPYVQDPWIDVNVAGYPSSPPPAGTTYVPVTAPGNPFSQTWIDQGQTTPESAPGNGDGAGMFVLARNRFIAYPRVYDVDNHFMRGVAGLKGDITDDLHWDTFMNINRYDLYYTNPGLIDTNALNSALASGQINPFAITQAAGAFNGVIGTAFLNGVSTLNEFGAKVDGSLFSLPAGKLGFAVGAEYTREGLSAVPDVNSLPNATGTTQGWSNATTLQPFDASRWFESFFGEVNIPVTSPTMAIPAAYAVDIDGAVRYDKYSGKVGSSTDPQVTLSWQPFDEQLKFRASAGKSFLAPQLYLLYGPVSAGSTVSITYNTASGGSKSAQFNQVSGANPLLKPSTANTWEAGVVYTPKGVPGLQVSIDYSDIYQKQVFGTIPANTIIQDVELRGTASPYIQYVHYNSPVGPTPTAAGGISGKSPQQIYVLENEVNLAAQRVDSTDIDVEYTTPEFGFGKFELSSRWTWYNRYLEQLIPTENFYNYVGTASQVQNTTIPRWRSYSTVDWLFAGFDADVGWTFVDSVTDVGVGGSNQSGFEGVSSFSSFDLGLGFDFGKKHWNPYLDGLAIKVGVNNVADKLPPLAVNAFPNTNADLGTYNGAVGRMYYVEAAYKF